MSIPVEAIEKLLDQCYPNFSYRPNQKEGILAILHTMANSKKRYIILDAPTGVGKSWIGRQVAEVFVRVYELSSLFITKTIALQNQYIEDFPEIKKLMSSTNYDCSVDHPVPIPPKHKHHPTCKFHKSSGLCDYEIARVEYANSNYKTLNYAFFLNGIEHYNTDGLLIADEAHNLEESILDTFDTKISFADLRGEGIGDIHLDNYLPNSELITHLTTEHVIALVEFLRTALGRISSTIDNIEEMLEEESDSKAVLKVLETQLEPLKRKMNKLGALHRIMALLASDNINRWDIHFDKEEKVFLIKPVFIPNFVHKAVFGMASKILFMSATAERVIESLKLPKSECEVFTLPYVFDIKNRPFYAFKDLPSLGRDSFDKSFPEYVKTVDAILDQYPTTTNVIVHSVSYKNAELLRNSSKHKDRIFIPTSQEVRSIKEHAGNGRIIVSPSITEGVDLGDGLAAVQIFLKVPYPFLGSSWVAKKMDYDEGWYAYKAMLTIIQGTGRGIRSATDKAETFMLDPSFRRLHTQTEQFVPKWFSDSITYI